MLSGSELVLTRSYDASIILQSHHIPHGCDGVIQASEGAAEYNGL